MPWPDETAAGRANSLDRGDEPIVLLRDVHKSFGALEVIKGISLDVWRSEVVCIIGPSGSGKSTLIRCINGLSPIQRGSIKVAGREVNDPKLDKLALRRNVGIVFQQYNLFPHKTAIENVMMAPLKVLREPRAEVEKRARALIAKVKLTGKETPIQASSRAASSSVSPSRAASP